MRIADLPLRGRLVVISPHLDDAALSIGASIARLIGAGAEVTVLTVLAGDPENEREAGRWDRQCGFSSAGEAVRARRKEEIRACEILGATAYWLPFSDEQYERGGTDDEIWAALEPQLTGADLVLVPGYPLAQPEHAWLSALLLTRLTPDTRTGLYVEQPYTCDAAIFSHFAVKRRLLATRVAAATLVGLRPLAPRLPAAISGHAASSPDWIALRASRHEQQQKNAAIRAYQSQLETLGPALVERIRLYEAAAGGERIGLLSAIA